ncbi:hypothetical protein [Enterococcus casseliflavus]|uniref:hypothetical protein n=1 Tax=Enterococcus casseliflavus TaxID=37734 RepID=UPI00115F156C|nr:hypothetical protein [Enterococcus casseliflavus]QOG29614.1 hypothetical protein EGM182_01695 [Enterococcus casseliflavus]
MAATGAPFYFTQKTAKNERFLVISCGFLLWTYVTVPFCAFFYSCGLLQNLDATIEKLENSQKFEIILTYKQKIDIFEE